MIGCAGCPGIMIGCDGCPGNMIGCEGCPGNMIGCEGCPGNMIGCPGRPGSPGRTGRPGSSGIPAWPLGKPILNREVPTLVLVSGWPDDLIRGGGGLVGTGGSLDLSWNLIKYPSFIFCRSTGSCGAPAKAAGADPTQRTMLVKRIKALSQRENTEDLLSRAPKLDSDSP